MDPRRYDWIDALRGVAILLVIADHAMLALPGWHGLLSRPLALGQTGVQLFFVASALTLCLSAQARGLGCAADLRDFWLRRLFRIAPLYWLGILLYWLNGRLQGAPAGPDAWQLIANASFTHGFIPSANNNVVPGGWSIGTEMAFYLVFPLLWRFGASLRSTVAVFAVALAAALAAGAWATRDGGAVANNGFLYFNLVTQLPVFLLGMLAFRCMRPAGGARAFGLLALSLGALAAGALAWAAGARLSFSVAPTLFGLGYACAALAIAAAAPGAPGSYVRPAPPRPAAWGILRASAFVQRVGRASYAIYVVHFLIVWHLAALLGRIAPASASSWTGYAALYLTATALSLLIAELLGRSIEQPCIRAGSALLRRLREPAHRGDRAAAPASARA